MRVTAVPIALANTAVGDAGVALFATVVEISEMALARLVEVNANGPPKSPRVIFCTFTVGILVLVTVHSAPKLAAVRLAVIVRVLLLIVT